MAMPHPPALSGHEECSADPAYQRFLANPSFDEVIESIADVIGRGSSGLHVRFRWAADDVENLHSKFFQLPAGGAISRFEYDYRSGIVSLRIGESRGHSSFAFYLILVILQKIRTIALTTRVEAVREAANNIIAIGTADIRVKGKLWNQPDGSFALLGNAEAKALVEIAWSQSQQDVEDKAENYIRSSNAKIRAVVVANATYPDLGEAAVGLGSCQRRRRYLPLGAARASHPQRPSQAARWGSGLVPLGLLRSCWPAGRVLPPSSWSLPVRLPYPLLPLHNFFNLQVSPQESRNNHLLPTTGSHLPNGPACPRSQEISAGARGSRYRVVAVTAGLWGT